MNLPAQISKHLGEVFFGGNWTCVNLKEKLADVTWQEAVTKVHDLNTIAALTYHTGYYITAVLKVLQGGPLDAHDKYSYEHPPINNQEDWNLLLNKTWTEAKLVIALVEQMPEERMGETMADEKYGSYYRNLQGIIEHTHYHLGQISLVKKMIRGNN